MGLFHTPHIRIPNGAVICTLNGGEHHARQAVPLDEPIDDRDDRQGLGLVAFAAADLQREPAPIDQQTHHDLGVDAAFLGVADLA